MKTVAIITEFNPFHKGHEYFLREVRKRSGADRIIAVMSGDFVQRGEPAVVGKYARSKAAVMGGCDLVLELPVRFSLSDAGGFAAGAFGIIQSLGCVDELWFGSECGTIQTLMNAAESLSHESPIFKSRLQSRLKNGMNYAAARAEALSSLYGQNVSEILHGPNNILGIEYCTAAIKSGSRIRLNTITRQGGAYDDPELSDGFSGALAIRKALQSADKEGISPEVCRALPDYSLQTLKDENGFLFADDFSLLLRYRLLEETTESLYGYAGVSQNLARRIKNLENEFLTLSDFILKIKTKNYTYSHVSRALFAILLKIKKHCDLSEAKSAPIRMLAMKEGSEDLPGLIKEKGSIPVTSSASDCLFEDCFAYSVYESVRSLKTAHPFVHESSRRFLICRPACPECTE